MKVGVIGLGDIAQKAYLPVYSSIEGIEFHLFTRNEEKLKEISRKYRMAYVHSELRTLIESGISAAFVHSSTDSHLEIVKELLINNIHVYVDKPITYHYESAKELVDLAEKRNLILMTGFNRRFAPMYKAGLEVTEPNFIILQKNRHALPGEPRIFVFDDFIHVIDTVRYLLPGEIDDIRVTAMKKDHMLLSVIVQFKCVEAIGLAIMNRDSGAVEEKLEIMGPNEKRIINNLAETIIFEGKIEKGISFSDWDSTLFKRGFEQIVTAFLHAVRTNTPPPITATDALKTHEICELIVKEIERQ